MSYSMYRDYNTDQVRSMQTGKVRPIISDPIPIEPLSSPDSAIPYADGDSPSPIHHEQQSMAMSPYAADDNYNSQPTLERSTTMSDAERSASSSYPRHISSPTDTVDTVIHNPGDRSSHYSSLEPRSGSQRSVGNFEPLIRPEELHPSATQDVQEAEISAENNSESQKLMSREGEERQVQNKTRSNTASGKSKLRRADSYAPGSCYYCLRTLSCKNLFLWMSLIISLIGWSVSIWRSIDSMDDMSHLKLRTGYSLNGFALTDMTVIVISTATFLFSVVFLLVSTYTSESLSSYHLESSQSNKCAYCFTITMSLFSCFAVVLWTLIIAATMIPTTIISVVHFLFKSGSASCVHLPSYGIQTPIVVGVSDTQSTIQLHCNDDLEDWLEKSWILMTPLLISLGCAVLIEMVLMGFIMVVSSNGRHLYERMGYLGDTKTTHDNSNDGGRQRAPFI